jgi:uncharacterized membrane protein
MELDTYSWVLSAHLIGVFLWIGCLIAVYWLLRVHTHTPKDAQDQLTLMERSLAMVMDLAATVAIVCGLVMALTYNSGGIPPHPSSTLFTAPHAGWFHIKLTIVVLGILPVHGLVRARVGQFSRGKHKKVPSWPWTVLLVSIVLIVIMVVRGPAMFAAS